MINENNLRDVAESLTIKLLRIMEPLFMEPRFKPLKEVSEGNDIESLELHGYAIKNKVSLLYLESLKQQEKISELQNRYEEEHKNYLDFLGGLNRISDVLGATDIEYLIMKTIRPYPCVPNDIDVLILSDDSSYKKSIEKILEAGYSELHRSSTGTILLDNKWNVDIDLQKEVSVGDVVYMDKDKFGECAVKTKLQNGCEIICPKPELELAIVIIHSLIENLYTMGDYCTALYQLAKMNKKEINNFIGLLEENKIVEAARAHITITTKLYEVMHDTIPKTHEFIIEELGINDTESVNIVKNNSKMPHRYSLSTEAKIFYEKMGEKKFRRSVVRQMIKMLNPNVAKLVINEIIKRRGRESY